MRLFNLGKTDRQKHALPDGSNQLYAFSCVQICQHFYGSKNFRSTRYQPTKI